MSNAVFPNLPGLKWTRIKKPIWKTVIQESVSGKECRAAFMSYPLYVFTLEYEILRSDAVNQECQQLLGFFLRMQGSFDTFLYSDPEENTVTAQAFGVGDGVTTAFQLTRTIGENGVGFVEPVQNVNGVPSIFVAGSQKITGTDYTIGNTGIVTFITAPLPGQSLTWTGSYYFRCRFLQDEAEFQHFMQNLWSLNKLEFRSVKV